MKRKSVVLLILAAALFAIFFSNVTLGALGQKPPFGDIQEMLILFASSICFAVSVLFFEAEHRRKHDGNGS